MATILRQQLDADGVRAELFLTREEARELAGEMEDVLLIPQTRVRTPSRVSLRGKREATKYFLIPRTLRRSLNLFGSVSCQRIQRPGHDVFIYLVEKDSERNSYLVPPANEA
jgi:hypothetical protein